MSTNPLGEFLRSRRGRVSPGQAGLPTYGLRRVPGLRREEVATLAGVSIDYYVRLEQGRERNPSAQVIDAIASVLQLDDDAHDHLAELAGIGGRPRSVPAERVAPELLALMDTWADNPALVLGRAYDVLAVNRLGAALFGSVEGRAKVGANLVRTVFLDPAARQLYAEWDRVATATVAGLRVLRGQFPHDPRITQVVNEVRAGAPEFDELWSRQDVGPKRAAIKRFRHPQVGDLALRMHVFDVRAAPGQELVVYHAESGSTDATALRLLGSLVATGPTGTGAPADGGAAQDASWSGTSPRR
ncbi:helix-turn-helix transcriptional regulator [Nocardioides sp. 1609]|uniref:helix-turn-helix domain-containing protein n=1 Tax=Nocardioides sp. 1609 TaxID=2508327 RepID=UPI00106FEF0B|nr:helix-turn-helix transcriptional regulator [Nocardioides sp. 1609]